MLRAVILLSSFVFAASACGERGPTHETRDAGHDLGDAGAADARSSDADAAVGLTRAIVGIVFDGDTIAAYADDGVLAPDGKPLDGAHVRFLGIDAPEIAHPPKAADCWGDEAKAAVDPYRGRVVELEFDEENGLRDAFDRLLAYIHVDGKVLNEELLRDGDVSAFRQFPHRHRDRYVRLEERARAASLGMWSCPR